MKPSQVIVLATPVFLALIALEWWVGRRRGRDTYRAHDAMASIGLGILSQVGGLFTRLLAVGMYAAAYQYGRLFELDAGHWATWVCGLLLYDLLYYLLHRMGHRVGVFWAAHVVHHQSEDYNLSTALRQTSSGALLGWIPYLPMALLGFPPLVFGTVALIDLLYQFWVHTQQVGRLGWFDRVFCSPSNHRVHHAVNDRYLDRNYGGILILWDRLFGTFQEERDDDPPVYGTRAPLRSFDPLWANLQVYAALGRDAWRTRSWADKLRVWFKPPGWRPADVAAADPKPAFDAAAMRKWDPQPSPAALWTCGLLFVVALAATSALLWQAHAMAWGARAGAAASILVLLVAIGRLSRGRTVAGASA